MNKIYFRFGTMFSGKTLNLISTVKTYELNGYNVIILKHSKDTRDTVIKSRMSNDCLDCITFDDNDNLEDVCQKALDDFYKENPLSSIAAILIDEVQFCSLEHIHSLHAISKIAPVICYGLKTSYTGELFPAISALLAIAEDTSEIKTICSMCSKKATHNLLLRNGQPIYSGDTVNIEGENVSEQYKAVCRKHFYEPIINITYNKENDNE